MQIDQPEETKQEQQPAQAAQQAALPQYDYDVFVIGGGSGGISCARTASIMGTPQRTAIADFVEPTPSNTKWGLGGTCVNVGCIPKKMMHYAATLAEARKDMAHQGWNINEQERADWATMVGNIQMHIKSLNFGFIMDLNKNHVQYFNEYASFVDQHTLQLKKVSPSGEATTRNVTADKIVIAVGGRPSYPDIPGAREFGITSDDLFSL